MKNFEKLDMEALKSIEEVSEEDLVKLVGSMGPGAIETISHECKYNTWGFLATCCGW